MRKIFLLFILSSLFCAKTMAQGNVTTVGNNTFSGNNTHSGTETFTGATLTKNFDTIRFASQYAGADFCTQANNADADIGANPGEIWIDANVASTTCAAVLVQSGIRIYRFVGSGAALNNFTIPTGDFVFTQMSLVDCGANLRTNLTFTGVGNAFKFQWTVVADSYDSWGYGVQNCRLSGAGGLSGNASSAGVGFQIGDGTHANTIGLLLNNVHSYGFATDVVFGNCAGSFGASILNSSFHSPQNLSHTSCSGGAIAENISLIHDIFTANSFAATGMVANSVLLGGTGLVEINGKDISFDGAQVNNTGARFRCEDCHFENPAANVASATTYYLIQGAGINNNTTLINPLFGQDYASGTVPNAFINLAGGNLAVYGYESFTNVAMPENILVTATPSSYQIYGVKNTIGTFTNGMVSGLASWSLLCGDTTQVCTLNSMTMKILGASTAGLVVGGTSAAPNFNVDVNGTLSWPNAAGSCAANSSLCNITGFGLEMSTGLNIENVIPSGGHWIVNTTHGGTSILQVNGTPNPGIAGSCGLTVDATDCVAASETAAATGGTLTTGLANQALVSATTTTNSTATPIEVVQGSITNTVATPLAQFESTWNNAGLTGQGILEDITNTNSAAGSKLLNLRVGGTTQFSADKAGNTVALGTVTSGLNGTVAGSYVMNGSTSGSANLTAPAVAGTITNPVTLTNSLQLPSGTVYNINNDVGWSRDAAGIVDIGNGTAGNASGFERTGNTVVLTSNFTTASATLVTITGLSWTFPATNHNYRFFCNLSYSQATAAAANSWGIQATTTAPTNLYAAHETNLALTTATAAVNGTLPTLTTTTATNIGGATWTPSLFGPIGTVADIFTARIWGMLEQGAGATTLNIMALTGNVADSLTIYRGSSCSLGP